MNSLPNRKRVWGWQKERPQWRFFSLDSNPPKKPLDENHSGKNWNDPGCWYSFDEACEIVENDDTFDGIGFVVSKADSYYGIDIDGALCEPNEMKFKEWVPSLDTFANQTAMQFSTSGTGLHVFAKGEIPEWWTNSFFEEREHVGVEAYEEHFFIITGNPLPVSTDAPAEIDPTPFLAQAWQTIRDDDPPPFRDSDHSRRTETESDNEVYRALDDLDPHRLNLQSSYVGDEHSEVESWNPGYRSSESGRSLKRWKSNGIFIDMADADYTPFGPLDILAAEQGIINKPHDSLDGEEWKEAYQNAREQCEDLPPLKDLNPAAEDREINHDGDPPAISPVGIMREALTDEYGRLQSNPDGASPTIHDLRNSESATYLWDVLEDRGEVDVIAVSDGTLRAYDGAIWIKEGDAGEQLLRDLGHQALQATYSSNVLKQLKEETRARHHFSVDEMGIDEPWIVAGNKAINLRTRQTRLVVRDDRALRRINVEYDPSAEPDLWFDFLTRVAARPETVEKLQEYFGYCLWIHGQPFGKALFLIGPPDSGKGTALKTLLEILGPENVATEALRELVDSRWGRAQLYGRSANIRNEITPRGIQNVEMFKELLGGGDRVSAERKGEQKFQFTVNQKFLFATNRFPTVRNADLAFWKRCLFARFPETIPKEEQDKNLHQRLLNERAGILNWMLDGLDRLFEQEGFTGERAPEDKIQITEEIGSPLQQMKQDALQITSEPTDIVHARDLYHLAVAYVEGTCLPRGRNGGHSLSS